MMDIPDSIDKHVDILIPGIESEEVEEINDAYKDILEELGNDKLSSSSKMITFFLEGSLPLRSMRWTR